MKTFIEIKHYEEGEPHTWTFTALLSQVTDTIQKQECFF